MNSVLNHPLVWTTSFGLFLALIAFIGFLRSKGGKRVVCAVTGTVCILLPAWLLVAVFAPGWIDARYRTYLAFYEAVQPGMNRFEVLGSLEQFYPTDGPRQRPKIVEDTDDELGFLMRSEQTSGTTVDGISVIFADGKVVRKYFSPD